MKRFKINLYVTLSALVLGALLLTMVASRAQASFRPGDESDPSGDAPEAAVLDHYWCYSTAGNPVNAVVQLKDQFNTGLVDATVGAPKWFCDPVKKKHNDQTYKIIDPNANLTLYKIGAPTQHLLDVQVNNQFGKQPLQVFAPALYLAVPTTIVGTPAPKSLDHFKCYQVKGATPQAVVSLKDKFTSAKNLVLGKPVLLCNPTIKVHDGKTYPVQHAKAHLVCYKVKPTQFNKTIAVTNQFGAPQLNISNPGMLCAPSTKKVTQ